MEKLQKFCLELTAGQITKNHCLDEDKRYKFLNVVRTSEKDKKLLFKHFYQTILFR